MSNLLWLVRKTLFNTFRSKKKWASYIGLPLVGVIVSFLIYGNVHGGSLRIGIVNADSHAAITQDAIAYVSGLQAVKVTNVDNAELNRQLVAGKLDVGLVFKEGFGQSVRNGHPDGVSIVSVKGAQVTRYTKAMLDAYIANIAAIGTASGADDAKFRQMYHDYRYGTFQVTARTLGDVSAKKNTGYQSIGFLLLFMLFSAFNMTDLILKEKENRTYYRQLSSPVTARTYILANVTVSILVLALQIAVTLFVMKYAFHLAEGVSLLETGGILLLFGLGAVSLSLMVIAFAKTSASAGALMNLIVTPTCLLSGCFFPLSIMPDVLQKIAQFLPQRWLLDSFTKLQEGSGIGSLALNILILLAFAAAFALVAIYKMSRNNDTRTYV